MLQHRTVHPTTLELLKKLMHLPESKDFFLVGGTALALQLGHRFSEDLDLFTLNEFDSNLLFEKLEKQFSITDKSEQKNTLNINIVSPKDKIGNIVKVDFVRYFYPLLKPIKNIENIRLLEIEDIIPMKLSAIAGRGSKKDFYDLFFLLKSYSIEKMFELFRQKFPTTNEFQIIKSLTYFEDAELEPNPITFDKVSWNSVKETMILETSKYSKI